jgi:hypothetical protein
VATIGPVAVGVTLAFAWNLAISQPRHAAEDQSRVTRQTVQQAAGQARARAGHAPEGGAGGRQDTRQARSG